MRKRPVCMGALFLLVLLTLAGFLKPGGVSPLGISGFSGKDTFPGRVKAAGRVKAREPVSGGIRLYLDHFSLKSSHLHSNQISETNSFKNPGIQTGIYSQNDSGSYQMIVYLKEGQTASVGSRILLEGELSLPGRAGNPGQFDAASYYLPRKILLILQDGVIEKQLEEGKNFTGFLAAIREKLQDSYWQVLGEEQAGTISAITLGDRSGLPEEIKTIYQEGGIAHVLAISSLHITLLGRGLYRLLRKSRLSFLTSGILSLALIFSFCQMTGMSVSAQRACLMFGLWVGSQILGRTNDGLTSLSLAAILVLLASPDYRKDGSFLLSFGCVLSLQLLVPVLKRLFPLRGKLGDSLCSSAAVTIGTLPVVMYFFYQFTPYSVLVNLAVIPCMSLLMVSGLLGSLLGCISIPLGTLAAAPCHYLLELFELLCRLERKLPGAVMVTGRPKAVQIGLFYLLLALLWLLVMKGGAGVKGKKGRKKKVPGTFRAAGIGVLAGAFCLMFFRQEPRLRIVYLDVGQGDCALVQAGNFSCLIDGGSSSLKGVWQYRMEGVLKYYGVSDLDAVFLSHGDADHINGVREMLEEYETDFLGKRAVGITVRRLFLPDLEGEQEQLEQIADLAGRHSIPVDTISRGQILSGGSVKLTCLHPGKKSGSGDANEDSMVLMLECAGIRALFTGDLEGEGEKELLKEQGEALLEADLLKVGHHGSKNGTSAEFLEKVKPEAAVISCGENNRYGHPSPQVLERLDAAGAHVYRTDRAGAVILEVKGEKALIKSYGSSVMTEI